MVINHKEALDLAYIKRENSNLARAYIELRTLAIAALETREAEAKAAMAAENAQANFHRYEAEYRAHEKAMIEASEAEKALRNALATPNVELTGAARHERE